MLHWSTEKLVEFLKNKYSIPMGQRFVLVLKSLSVILLFLIAFEVKGNVDLSEKKLYELGS